MSQSTLEIIRINLIPWLLEICTKEPLNEYQWRFNRVGHNYCENKVHDGYASKGDSENFKWVAIITISNSYFTISPSYTNSNNVPFTHNNVVPINLFVQFFEFDQPQEVENNVILYLGKLVKDR